MIIIYMIYRIFHKFFIKKFTHNSYLVFTY